MTPVEVGVRANEGSPGGLGQWSVRFGCSSGGQGLLVGPIRTRHASGGESLGGRGPRPGAVSCAD